jgi:hypothetical protein
MKTGQYSTLIGKHLALHGLLTENFRVILYLV